MNSNWKNHKLLGALVLAICLLFSGVGEAHYWHHHWHHGWHHWHYGWHHHWHHGWGWYHRGWHRW